jgi:hypothetical protein
MLVKHEVLLAAFSAVSCDCPISLNVKIKLYKTMNLLVSADLKGSKSSHIKTGV